MPPAGHRPPDVDGPEIPAYRLVYRSPKKLEEGAIGIGYKTFAVHHAEKLIGVVDCLSQRVDLCFDAGTLGEFLLPGDKVSDFPILAVHRTDGHSSPIEAAVFAAIGEITLPLPSGKNCLPHLLVKGRGMLIRLEQARIPSNGLLLRVTRQILESCVGPDDRALAVCDKQCVVDNFHSAER